MHSSPRSGGTGSGVCPSQPPVPTNPASGLLGAPPLPAIAVPVLPVLASVEDVDPLPPPPEGIGVTVIVDSHAKAQRPAKPNAIGASRK